MKVPMYMRSAGQVNEIEVSDAVFGVEGPDSLVHSAVLRSLANGRQGSASTKTRGEVRGGGRKPWRQKGTGRARHGSIRSPIWRGGGVTFGPRPRDFSQAMNRRTSCRPKSAMAA
jgi:large subunit ribosomal protein L4